MPRAVFKSVREVSSEDENFKAENLLRELPGKSWKTKTAGEKQAYVILELTEAQQITGIDVGNEHSAFVEVLVGKTACTRDDFKEILITCSFMTPIESRTSDNPNRVRCFNKDALVPTVAEEKWQMVKIICTQPFNKHVPYGLAFIKLHIVDNGAAKVQNKPQTLVPQKFMQKIESAVKIGKFTLRDESPESDTETTEGLFRRWKDKSLNGSLLKSASPSSLKNSQPSDNACKAEKVAIKETPVKIRDRNRSDLAFVDEHEDRNKNKMSIVQKLVSEQIENQYQRLQKAKELRKDENQTPDRKKANQSSRLSSDDVPSTSKGAGKPHTTSHRASLDKSNSDKTRANGGGLKRYSSPSESSAVVAKKAKTDNIVYCPFHQLLRGVVLVISGIQNPDRADLRGKALAMGAKYRADWEDGCTHLICAFKNTPKYNQVKGQGKIIKRTWIEECYASKKYLPWRRFALDSAETDLPESDVELWEESLRPATNETELKKKSPVRPNCVEDLEMSRNPTYVLSSGSDTEDEIERVKQMNRVSKKSPTKLENGNKKAKKLDEFDESTEEEDYLKEKLSQFQSNGKCLRFFDKLKFFLCNDINVVARIKLETHIKKYAGQLTHDLREAQYAITEQGMTDPSDAVGFAGVTVQPRWIYECHDLQMKVPTQRYLI